MDSECKTCRHYQDFHLGDKIFILPSGKQDVQTVEICFSQCLNVTLLAVLPHDGMPCTFGAQ